MTATADAEAALQKLLMGQSLEGFALGDVWRLRFSGRACALAFDLSANHLDVLGSALAQTGLGLLDGRDPEDVLLSVAIARNLGEPLEDIRLHPTGLLELGFRSGWVLRFGTAASIVDWQWAVNRSGHNPYADQSDTWAHYTDRIASSPR